MIKDTSTICYNDIKTFTEELCKVLNDFQSKGWDVEIKYSMNKGNLSALVVARSK